MNNHQHANMLVIPNHIWTRQEFDKMMGQFIDDERSARASAGSPLTPKEVEALDRVAIYCFLSHVAPAGIA